MEGKSTLCSSEALVSLQPILVCFTPTKRISLKSPPLLSLYTVHGPSTKPRHRPRTSQKPHTFFLIPLLLWLCNAEHAGALSSGSGPRFGSWLRPIDPYVTEAASVSKLFFHNKANFLSSFCSCLSAPPET